MRHDWEVAPSADGFRSQLRDALFTWRADGIGRPNVYPTNWLSLVVQWLLTWLFSPRWIIGIYLAVIAALAAVACRRLCSRDQQLLPVTLLGFVLFNPWCFTELVAGHLGMMLAYAATLALLAELRAGRVASTAIVGCVAAISAQLQYLVGVEVIGLVVGALSGDFLIAFAALLFFAPALIGILGEHANLAAIPYLLTWQRSQSLSPTQAPLLLGYFAAYTQPAAAMFALGVSTFGVSALVGCFLECRRRSVQMLAMGTVCVLFYACGTLGPWPQAYAWLVVHVHATALFRELYDLIGYVAIGYIVLAATAGSRIPAIGMLLALGVFCLLDAWGAHRPSTYWVDAESLPRMVIAGRTDSRFVLLPPFQPLRYRGQGSGTYPDLYTRSGNITPLNQYFPTYPVQTALGAFMNDRRTNGLSALGVSTIISRPHFSSDTQSLHVQLGVNMPAFSLDRMAVRMIEGLPLLSLLPFPEIGSLNTNLGAGNIFMLDAMDAGIADDLVRRFRIMTDREASTDAGNSWADIRLAFMTDPQYGQLLGGVYTRSTRLYPLEVAAGERLLTFVRGTLRDDAGNRLASDTGGYAWIPITHPLTAVRCHGTCAIVAAAIFERSLPLNPPVHSASALALRTFIPWLATAVVPKAPNCQPLLRYNVQYDPAWTAWMNGKFLRHLRIDGVVNGWLIPCTAAPHRVVFVEILALLEQLAEVFVTIAVGWILFVRREIFIIKKEPLPPCNVPPPSAC